MDVTNNNESVQHIAELAVSGSLIKTDIPYAVVPRGYEVESLEKFIVDEKQVKQSVTVTSASSLIAYVVRFKDDRSVIFADTENTRFRGVLDYHLDGNTPFKNTHTVTYDCPHSEEWKAFTQYDKKSMNQV